MPTYQYHCEECGKMFERVETMSEHEVAKPPEMREQEGVFCTVASTS